MPVPTKTSDRSLCGNCPLQWRAPSPPWSRACTGGRTDSHIGQGGRVMTKSLKLAAVAIASVLLAAPGTRAEETIKVGILHSLSGTMAISETSLKDVALMTIEEINAKGGLLGKKIQPVVLDPASNCPLFTAKARHMLLQH